MFQPEKIHSHAFRYYPRLGRVKRYVDQHFHEPLTLATVAGVAGLERTYFSKFFHDKTGVCFRDWLNWIRVGHALELMAEGERSITDVALEVGFHDLRTFERAVERCTGHTPRMLKRRLCLPPDA